MFYITKTGLRRESIKIGDEVTMILAIPDGEDRFKSVVEGKVITVTVGEVHSLFVLLDDFNTTWIVRPSMGIAAAYHANGVTSLHIEELKTDGKNIDIKDLSVCRDGEYQTPIEVGDVLIGVHSGSKYKVVAVSKNQIVMEYGDGYFTVLSPSPGIHAYKGLLWLELEAE